jgi:hypothetical protein
MRFILLIVFLLIGSNQASANVFGLLDVKHTQTRLLMDLDSDVYDPLRTAYDYVPVYRTTVSNGQSGDIFKIAAQIETSEKNRDRAKVWAYVRVIRPNGTEFRVTPFSWQWAERGNNHHMPMHLFGSYEATQSGVHTFEIMARATSTEQIDLDPADRFRPLQDSGVVTRSVWVEFATEAGDESYASDFGQLIVEHYRSFSTVSAAQSNGSRGIVDHYRKFTYPIIRVTDTDNNGAPNYYDAGQSKPFSLGNSDILRGQSLATAQYLSGSDINLFSLELLANTNGVDDRVSVSTENVVPELYRFSLQNDALHRATATQSVRLKQRVRGITDHPAPYDLLQNNREIAAVQFSGAGAPKYLKESRRANLGSDTFYAANGTYYELLSISGANTGGNILRLQGQVQADLQDLTTSASCSARIEVWEDGVKKYASLLDQRFVQNRHPSATYAPFGVYELSALASIYDIKLLVRCSSTKPTALVKYRYYGNSLFVDRFEN